MHRFSTLAGWRGSLAALALGLISATGFQPLGLWPFALLALTGLMALVLGAGTRRRALSLGWWFGLGPFTLGLNWIATAFTSQAAMPGGLGWKQRKREEE